jgi:hypothetical protein
MGLKMKFVLPVVAILGLLVLPVRAGQGYDPMIAAAAARIVAGKIGDIRGGFSWNVRLVEIVEPAAAPAPPAPDFTVTGSIVTLN